MKDYRIFKMCIFDFATGRTVWSGDPRDVLGMLTRIDTLQGDTESLTAAVDNAAAENERLTRDRDDWKEIANSWERAYHLAEQRVEKWKRRALHARRKYHEADELTRTLFGARRKDMLQLIADIRRQDELEQAIDQGVSNLQGIANLAIGCDDESTIITIVQETAANLLAVLKREEESQSK